jgi:tRNA1Val (adenine37-N6)-methyltransferase
MIDPPVQTNETLDSLFQGRVKFYQSRSGYRVSLDAILLADFATIREGDRVADLGTGNGVVALLMASRQPSCSIVGVEVQAPMAERAARNVKLNRLEKGVQIVCADVRAIAEKFKPESFSLVTANPPYRTAKSGRMSPEAEKKTARHELTATLNDFIVAASYILPVKGRMTVVYPAVRAADLLTSLRGRAIEPKRLRMVHSFRDSEASLVLAEGVKGGRAGIKVLPPLVLYAEAKRYSPEIAALLAGTWFPSAVS